MNFLEGFDQVYLTTAYPEVVKVWHHHTKQDNNVEVVKRMMKIVLFDGRKESPTYDEVNEFFAGEDNPILVHIPHGIYHGFKCISESEALIVNVPTQLYNYDYPDEFRLPPHNSSVTSYIWEWKDG